MGFEHAGSYGYLISKCSISKNQSYIKSRGRWYDVKGNMKSSIGNVRIKAYTKKKK